MFYHIKTLSAFFSGPGLVLLFSGFVVNSAWAQRRLNSKTTFQAHIPDLLAPSEKLIFRDSCGRYFQDRRGQPFYVGKKISGSFPKPIADEFYRLNQGPYDILLNPAETKPVDLSRRVETKEDFLDVIYFIAQTEVGRERLQTILNVDTYNFGNIEKPFFLGLENEESRMFRLEPVERFFEDNVGRVLFSRIDKVKYYRLPLSLQKKLVSIDFRQRKRKGDRDIVHIQFQKGSQVGELAYHLLFADTVDAPSGMKMFEICLTNNGQNPGAKSGSVKLFRNVKTPKGSGDFWFAERRLSLLRRLEEIAQELEGNTNLTRKKELSKLYRAYRTAFQSLDSEENTFYTNVLRDNLKQAFDDLAGFFESFESTYDASHPIRKAVESYFDHPDTKKLLPPRHFTPSLLDIDELFRPESLLNALELWFANQDTTIPRAELEARAKKVFAFVDSIVTSGAELYKTSSTTEPSELE